MDTDDADIEPIATALLQAAVAATPAWVAGSVERVVMSQGIDRGERYDELVVDAGERARRYVEQHLGVLLETDIDRQTSTPLTVFRDAARFPVEVLHTLGAAEVHRIDVDRWAFPNDPFGVTPAALGDVGPEVHEAGLAWGAAKAHVHLRRRREEGQA